MCVKFLFFNLLSKKMKRESIVVRTDSRFYENNELSGGLSQGHAAFDRFLVERYKVVMTLGESFFQTSDDGID